MSSTPETDPQPTDALAGKLKRTEIQHKASSIPGREIVQVLTEIPCGVESGWHIHPGEEVGYILAGTVKMMIQDQPTLTLHAGDGFLMPPRHAPQRARHRPRHRPDALHLHRRGRTTASHIRRWPHAPSHGLTLPCPCEPRSATQGVSGHFMPSLRQFLESGEGLPNQPRSPSA